MDKQTIEEKRLAVEEGLKGFLPTTEGCRYCLMCRHVCPVGQVTQSETLSPHGWALTIASVKRGLLGWEEQTVDVLYQCADCGACQDHCVTDQPLPSAIAAARTQVVEQGVAPDRVCELDEALQQWANPYSRTSPAPVDGRGQTALFVGDAAQYLCPETLQAALSLVRAAGLDPVLVGVGRSSGFLASSLGLAETAVALAQAVVGEIEACGCSRLLVLSPGDHYAFAHVYGERLSVSWPPEVEILELSSLLADALKEGKLSFGKKNSSRVYAYVDPPHTSRVRRAMSFEAPRLLAAAALGGKAVELFWRRERAHPCGAVGGLEFTQPELAARLTRARLADAQRAGAGLLLTEDPLCLNHLKEHADPGVEVRGLYELLAERLD